MPFTVKYPAKDFEPAVIAYLQTLFEGCDPPIHAPIHGRVNTAVRSKPTRAEYGGSNIRSVAEDIIAVLTMELYQIGEGSETTLTDFFQRSGLALPDKQTIRAQLEYLNKTKIFIGLADEGGGYFTAAKIVKLCHETSYTALDIDHPVLRRSHRPGGHPCF